MRAPAALLLALCACTEDPVPAGPTPPTRITPRQGVGVAAPVKPAAPTPGFDGVVVNAAGAPVAAKLVLTPQGKAPVPVSTDGSGKFSAPELPDGELAIALRAEGEVPTFTSVYLPQHGYVLKMAKGDTLTLTSFLHVHDLDDQGRDGPVPGPLLEEGTVDVWWQSHEATWEKLATATVREHTAQVRVPPGEIYLEVNALGRCGAHWLVAKGDAAVEVGLDGEAVDGTLHLDSGKVSFTGWEVTVVPFSPTGSACLRRTAKVGPSGAFSIPTTDLSSSFTVEVKPPNAPARPAPGKAAGGRSLDIAWTGRGPVLIR